MDLTMNPLRTVARGDGVLRGDIARDFTERTHMGLKMINLYRDGGRRTLSALIDQESGQLVTLLDGITAPLRIYYRYFRLERRFTSRRSVM